MYVKYFKSFKKDSVCVCFLTVFKQLVIFVKYEQDAIKSIINLSSNTIVWGIHDKRIIREIPQKQETRTQPT